jgi:hypothetical protein
MHILTTTPPRVNARSIYRTRPLVARLIADGIFGTGNAWRRWPRPQTGRRYFVLVDGGRR